MKNIKNRTVVAISWHIVAILFLYVVDIIIVFKIRPYWPIQLVKLGTKPSPVRLSVKMWKLKNRSTTKKIGKSPKPIQQLLYAPSIRVLSLHSLHAQSCFPPSSSIILPSSSTRTPITDTTSFAMSSIACCKSNKM